MMRRSKLIIVTLIIAACASSQAALAGLDSKSGNQAIISEESYKKTEQNILGRIAELKKAHASLKDMETPFSHQYNVTWVLDDPTKPRSKLNGQQAVFGKDGYWFSLQFYRGKWMGAAVFVPIEFGDLKLQFSFGHGGNTSVLAAVARILKEENDAFCRKHALQCPNLNLLGTAGERSP